MRGGGVDTPTDTGPEEHTETRNAYDYRCGRLRLTRRRRLPFPSPALALAA